MDRPQFKHLADFFGCNSVQHGNQHPFVCFSRVLDQKAPAIFWRETMVLECFFTIVAEGSWNFTLLVVHTMYRWKRHWGFYYVSTAEPGTFLKRLEAGCIAQKEKSNFLLEKGGSNSATQCNTYDDFQSYLCMLYCVLWVCFGLGKILPDSSGSGVQPCDVDI